MSGSVVHCCRPVGNRLPYWGERLLKILLSKMSLQGNRKHLFLLIEYTNVWFFFHYWKLFSFGRIATLFRGLLIERLILKINCLWKVLFTLNHETTWPVASIFYDSIDELFASYIVGTEVIFCSHTRRWGTLDSAMTRHNAT